MTSCYSPTGWFVKRSVSHIFIFVITGHPAGIGFLVAAKSILRFEEAKEQKLAEYVLIGTLLSFSLGTAFAAATKWALGQ